MILVIFCKTRGPKHLQYIAPPPPYGNLCSLSVSHSVQLVHLPYMHIMCSEYTVCPWSPFVCAWCHDDRSRLDKKHLGVAALGTPNMFIINFKGASVVALTQVVKNPLGTEFHLTIHVIYCDVMWRMTTVCEAWQNLNFTIVQRLIKIRFILQEQ